MLPSLFVSAFGVGGAYQQNRTVTYAAPNENRKGLETFNIGGYIGIGEAKIFGHYLKSQNDNPVLRPEDVQNIVIATGGSLAAINNILGGLFINRFDVNSLRGVAGKTDMDLYHLGLEMPLGNGKLIAAYNHADFRPPLALVIGGEASGAGEFARRLHHQPVHIPMTPGVESLNAAAAAAVLLFEVLRQRSSRRATAGDEHIVSGSARYSGSSVWPQKAAKRSGTAEG